MRPHQGRRSCDALVQMDAMPERTASSGNRGVLVFGNPVIADGARFGRIDAGIGLDGMVSGPGGGKRNLGIYMQTVRLMLLVRQVEDSILAKVVSFRLLRQANEGIGAKIMRLRTSHVLR